jgi:two-component system, NtrC family, response regulator AtoC
MLQSAHVLVADDDKNGRRVLEILLGKLGCQISSAADGVEALDIIRTSSIDLLITDLNMPRMDGLKLLTTLRQENNEIPAIVVTAYGTVETAVAAMKQGAIDFILRPLDVDQVEIVVRHALESRQLKQENLFLRDQLDIKGWGDFIGQSNVMQDVYNLIQRCSPSNASVFISGETGSGKELAARAIHHHSGRTGLFVPVNCAAIPPNIMESELFGHVRGAFTGAIKDRIGKFEFANKGTIFLDEITEMDLDIQAKLLRVLQENTIERLGGNRSFEIDIRIIAATNRNPAEAVPEGRLREDLFYRLNVVNIHLPPLRERTDDILLLTRRFIEQYCKQMGIPALQLSETACNLLTAYPWPGNVRELKNVIERAVVLHRNGTIAEEFLPQQITLKEPQREIPDGCESNDLEGCVAELEIRLINRALQKAQGNKAKASRTLNISERTLWYKLKKYNLGTSYAGD